MFEETRRVLNNLGLPDRDYAHLPTSNKKFNDGSDFKIEIPSVNSIEAMDALLEESTKINIRINRITETYGIFRHNQSENQKMIPLFKNF